MYIPPLFRVEESAAWSVVIDAGAGYLVTASPDGLASVFVPVVVSEDRSQITTHVARANPWWRVIGDGAEVVGLFVAASAYVSPSLYPSRLEDPGVVPTWNYTAAEVRGRAIVHDDPTWLASQVRHQTDTFEDGRDPRWWVDDAPAPYIERQLRAIVGVSVTVTSIEGKAKLSQNRPAIDHDQVAVSFAAGSWRERGVAERMVGDL